VPDCEDYDIWAWGCGTWLNNNPRRKQAVDWLKAKYAKLQYTQNRQFIAHHYMRQKVYHFQQMGDNKIGGTGCRPFQMGRSTWERFVNFKHSFFKGNVNPSMTYQQAASWATAHFIGISVLEDGQSPDYHDQRWMLKHPDVLGKMGLL
jgi:hypothetical protein